MTGIERVQRILKHQPTDRIGLYEHFWSDTIDDWKNKGHIVKDDLPSKHLGLDMDEIWAFNCVIDLDHIYKTVDETEDTITCIDGNGETLKRHKKHDSTPEHIAFSITEREQWEEVKELLKPDERRINFEGYRYGKDVCKQDNRFFVGAE
jgi:uroporphyrinogen decarboxylase